MFKGPARELVYDLKYRNNKNLAPKLAAHMLAYVGSPDVITWVPLARRKRWDRGYNQSRLLARTASAASSAPAVRLLKRVRNTADQNRLTPEERRDNVKDAFAAVNPEKIEGKRILLIDDVYTTGATVSECAWILLAGGARSVDVLTLARA